MSAVKALILPPLFILILIGFVFGSLGSNSRAITNQIYMVNCPFPLENQIATLGNPPFIGGSNPSASAVGATSINYTVASPSQGVGNNTGTGTYFSCSIQSSPPPNNVPQVSTVIRNYGQTVVYFPVGAWQYFGDMVGFTIAKISNIFQLVYIFLVLPATLTGIFYFTIIQAVLLLLIGLGIVLAVRGS